MGKDRLNMNLHCFVSFFLLVIAVNGVPRANPVPNSNPNPDPKGKAQMAIIFNGRNGYPKTLFGRRGTFSGMGDVAPGSPWESGYESGNRQRWPDPWPCSCFDPLCLCR